MIRYTIVGLALLATACASPGVANKVDAAVVALTTAERLALNYTSLPRCGTSPKTPVVCSTPSVVAAIKAADQKAYDAVKAAEKNEAFLSMALVAIADLGTTVPK